MAYTSDPKNISPNASWLHGAPPEGKTLTEMLLNKNDLSFVAFGYEARNRFAAAIDKSNLLYFSNFKLVLHNKVENQPNW